MRVSRCQGQCKRQVSLFPQRCWFDHEHCLRVTDAPITICTTDPPKRSVIQQGGAINAIAFSPDGWLLVSGGEDKTLPLWDVSTLQVVT